MIVEKRTMTVYVHTIQGPCRRRRRWTREPAYLDAAWTKIRGACYCESPRLDEGDPGVRCRYHDPEYRAAGSGAPDDAPTFRAPSIWRVPADKIYGSAVAYRLARFYRYLDARSAPTPSREKE